MYNIIQYDVVYKPLGSKFSNKFDFDFGFTGGGAGGANVSNFPIKYKEIVCSSFCPYN